MKKERMKIVLILMLCLSMSAVSAQADDLSGSNSRLKVQPVIALQAKAFRLEDVRLLDGPFKHAMELDKQYLLSLDVDRLLHNFRINAGLPSTAEPLGGWEEPKCELRGHSVGHYMTACALMYASTGDEKLKEKGNAVVTGLAQCQDKLGTGYLSAYPESFFDRVEARQRVWAPYYTLHKIYAGLLDMYVYCDNQQALNVCKKFADWVITRNSKLTDEQMQAMLGTEFGGMNEVLANLYGLTGEDKYLKIAQRFNHMAVLGPASKQEDRLTGLHANTQIPKFIGTARQYELTGEDWLKTASIFFWDTVVKERSYVIGGNSDGESFSPKERLSQALGPNTTETCNTYNMLKLTRHLFCWDPKVEYADYYERALYNHILASQNPKDGMMCYYVPLRSGSHKSYSTPNNSFWCCTGTGIENHAKYGDSIYFHNDTNLWVNLFIASELSWKDKGLKLRQETKYPDQASSKLIFTCAKPVELVLNLRHPYWAVTGIEVTVNGEKQDINSKPGTWVTLSRAWKSGDTVDITMPFSLRTEGFKDNPNRFAFLNGPIVLAAEVDISKPLPAIVSEETNLTSSLKPVAGKPNTFSGPAGIFRIPGEKNGSGVTLEPFYKMHDNRTYIVYWDHLTAEQFKEKEAQYQDELNRQKEIEARTVDKVTPGDEKNERGHKLKGERSSDGEFGGRHYRHAAENGWFSWELKVLPDQPQELSVTYCGGDGSRRFDIYVDDTKLASERLSRRQSNFYDKLYPLSEELLKGKDEITVKFQAPANSMAGGVYGVRVLKKNMDPSTSSSTQKGDYPFQPVAFTDVKVDDEFWAPRIETNRTVSIPHAFKMCEDTGRIDNFAIAGGLMKGKFRGSFPFNDTDPYKILEGASYSLSVHPDPALDKYLDELIVKIAAAQEPDGYLYTTRTIDPNNPHRWAGTKRWEKAPELSHELYNCGHLYEAAVAHYQATGKRSLLDVAIKNADLLCRDFGPGKLSYYPGHQIVETGLVKMYRATGKKEYLDLAKFFLDVRGNGSQYNQSHKKVTEQTEAVGHAVRAVYMYSGMADVAALTGDNSYLQAIDKIWEDVVSKKLYLTGGIGATGSGEAFGRGYQLPNATAYCETCAAIGNVMWNYRMFLLHGDAKYIDVLERTLYNGLISGVSLTGDSFFYPNPLESRGQHKRSAWFDCACCPTNITRFIPSVPGYIYAHTDDALYVNLFVNSSANVKVGDDTIHITQETQYPWDGKVKIIVEPVDSAPSTKLGTGEFTLRIRIPGWAQERAVPSDLYRFMDNSSREIGFKVNKKRCELVVDKGYACVKRPWKKGDAVEIDIPMPVQRVLANEKVTADVDRVAFQRGPIVYCAEGPDNNGHVLNLVLPDTAKLKAERRKELLNGVTVLNGKAIKLSYDKDGKTVLKKPQDFTAIPYYAWAHRGAGEMAVWLARENKTAEPLTPPGMMRNPSFENAVDDRPVAWESQTYSGRGRFEYAKDGRTGRRCVTIASTGGADAGWLTTVTVKPHTRYRLSGWIKTENVTGSGRGALFNLHNIQPLQTPAVTGTKDWTRVELVFDSGELAAVQINCLFGGWGLSTGKAWFDDLNLEELPAGTDVSKGRSI
jgi:DUF1680 family protein